MRMFAALLMAAVALPASAVTLTGQFVQGGMVTGQAEPGAQVLLNGEPIKVGADGRFVFGFGRDATGEVELRIERPGAQPERLVRSIRTREYDIQRIDGLPPRTVTIPEEQRQRRAAERARVGAARQPVTDALDWTDGFIWPAEGRISGVYGSQRILNGQPRWPHYGIDIAGPTGTPVLAPAGGIIRLAAADFLLEGGIVIIDHGFGVTSTLFHLHSVDVVEGQAVTQGQQIGSIGATGRATGPHVDWRVNWRNVRLDPQLLVPDRAAQ
ncbi:MAG: M23 family metallopeptidase [Rhodothalassiaceae bacterium]